MAKRRSRRSANSLSVAKTASGNGWVLVHPRCVRDRAEDLEEVRAMIAAGEPDVAIDELRWLLEGCSEMIEAHLLLGQLAVEVDGDLPLARGHFGFGYQLGEKALRQVKQPPPLPALHPANRSFFEAGRGLVWCLHQLQKSEKASDVLHHLLQLDPTDPLRLAAWHDEIGAGSRPIVEIDLPGKNKRSAQERECEM